MQSQRQPSARQRYAIPSQLNMAITVAQVLVSLCLLWGASWAWQAGHLAWVLLAALVFSFVMQTGFSLLHEAEHRKLHANRKINDILGFLGGKFLLPISEI